MAEDSGPMIASSSSTSLLRLPSMVMDGSIYTFWSKSSVDIEPRRIRLQSNSYTTNTILDIVAAATVQMDMNLGHYFHPYVAQEANKAERAIIQEPMVFSTLNLGFGMSGKPEWGNSFPALLAGPSQQLQCEFQQLQYELRWAYIPILNAHNHIMIFAGCLMLLIMGI